MVYLGVLWFRVTSSVMCGARIIDTVTATVGMKQKLLTPKANPKANPGYTR